MKITVKPTFYVGLFCMTIGQNSFSTDFQFLQTLTQETEQAKASFMVAEVLRGVERRMDRRENVGDRAEDKQDFREERRDCVGEGPDCRSDNRQDNRDNRRDRTSDRVDDRQDRRRF